MAVKMLIDGFQSVEGKLEFHGDLYGPSAYLSANGQTLKAQEVMMTAIESLQGGLSASGTYYIRPQFSKSVNGSTSIIVRWYVTSTNAEANSVDLSGEAVRIRAEGI